MFVLIVVVWLGGATQNVTMQEFTTRERCEAGAQKVTELITKNRKSIAELERTGPIRAGAPTIRSLSSSLASRSSRLAEKVTLG